MSKLSFCIGVSLVAVAVLAGLGIAPTVAPPVDDPPVTLSVDQTLSPGVTAKGVLLLSAPLRSDDGSRRIRVAAFWITVVAGDDDRTDIKGAPSVELSSSTPHSTGTMSTVEKLRDGSRRVVSVGLELRTRASKTWADVRAGDDIEVRVIRDVQNR